MTPTDELRRMLTERGVEWYEPTMKPNTTWFPDAYGFSCRVKPWGDALCVKRYDLTPEQAVEATLGRPTCRLEREPDSDRLWWCSNCQSYHEHVSEFPWEYCPRCGAKVVR